MGKISEILAERRIGKRGMYSDHARLELSENIHLHWRDLRLAMSPADFEIFKDMVVNAFAKYEELGKPAQSEKPYEVVVGLCEKDLTDEGYHSDRLGVEEQEDGSIHAHYRDFRMHFKPADFMVFAQQLWLAYLQYNKLKVTKVDLSKVTYHPVVDKFLRLLEEDDRDDVQVPNFRDSISYFLLIKDAETHPSEDNSRPDGLPKQFPGEVDVWVNSIYLVSLSRSLKEYGYAKGPFAFQYLRVYKQKDGSLYVKDSHRLACLIHLGYKEIEAVVVDAESGWRE